MCICGKDFRKKGDGAFHVKEANDFGLTNHILITKLWRARLLDWFFNLPGRRITRCIGIYLVYIVCIKHFHIEWSYLESIVIGVGLGLAID